VGEPDLVVDGGRLEAAASTVVDASRTPWATLRDGPISAAEVIALGIG
jgi:tRNA A37 threonylcarbamoyladenosine synthetase subunit TsaC/SUA5/YrdC